MGSLAVRDHERAGRIPTMRTNPTLANGVPTNNGASLAIWNYSDTTGRLLSKIDANNQGPEYTHTAAGRIATRAWARDVTTSYGYTAGQLTSITYDDDTPDVIYSRDRLGRPATITQANQSQITYTYTADWALTPKPLLGVLQNHNFI